MSSLYALILAGGSGTRLWPMSRQASPKQLISLGRELSLFQETVSRIQKRVEPEKMVFVTSRDLEGDIKDHLRRYMGKSADDCVVVGESAARNTAPAILLGARIVQARDPDALLLVAPSDHIIQDTDSFIQAIDNSLEAAAAGMLVTYGITPTRAETGYGYIRAGQKEGKVFRVEKFEEKPTSARAEKLFKNKNYTWNSGIFLFSVKAIMEEAEKHLPALSMALKSIDPETLNGLDEVYSGIESISIDHGIMEKTGRAAVIPVSMGWSDLGSWDSYYEMNDKDMSGNVVTGDALSLDNEGCLIVAGSRFLGVVGMKDTIIIQTQDATLLCSRGSSQEVRRVVEHLEKEGRPEFHVHRTVTRPWGTFTVLEEGPAHKVKRIVVDPGQKLSLQMHRQRGEHWVVVNGEGIVTIGEEKIAVGPDHRIHIPVETKHRAENTGSEPLVFIEVQFGTYLGEDDIVRYEDDYGRTTADS